MASRQQLPIRLEFDPRAPNGVVAAPGGAYGTGAKVRRAASGVVQDAVARAAAGAPRAMPGSPVSAIAPIAAVLGSQRNRVAIRDFIDGLAGNPKGGARVPVVATAAPVRARPAAAAAQEALGLGRVAAPTPIAPQDRVAAFIDSQFRGPLTLREAAAFSGMLPNVAAARAGEAKGPKAKDVVLGQTAQLSQAIYQSQIDQATELAKTDPEGARAVTEKATAEYFNRQAGLVGFNPVNLAQSLLMAGADEEE